MSSLRTIRHPGPQCCYCSEKCLPTVTPWRSERARCPLQGHFIVISDSVAATIAPTLPPWQHRQTNRKQLLPGKQPESLQRVSEVRKDREMWREKDFCGGGI